MTQYDPDDPNGDQLKQRIQEVRLEEEERLLSLALSTEEGRFLAWLILDRSGRENLSFADSDRGTNFNEGRRSLGIELKNSIVALDPRLFEHLDREARQREELYRARVGE